jgi:hypothetical protein
MKREEVDLRGLRRVLVMEWWRVVVAFSRRIAWREVFIS